MRQAVRAGWDLKNPTLKEAIASLRPYRLGPPDEPINQLFARIVREVIRQQQEHDVEDIEDSEDERSSRVLDAGLENLLHEGTAILRKSGDEKWQLIKKKLLDPAGDEKVVLFAQPIETVVAICRFLEKSTDCTPALFGGPRQHRSVSGFHSGHEDPSARSPARKCLPVFPASPLLFHW